MRAQLQALLDLDAAEPFDLPSGDLATPKLSVPLSALAKPQGSGSRAVGAAQKMLEEAETRQTLAGYSYAPDFMFSFQKPFTNSPPDAYSIGVEVSVPLWFFAKQSSEVAMASARAREAEKNLAKATRETQAETKSLSVRVETYEKLIRIYETSLIPQATSALNSSRAAYGAGRAPFLELLDSERSLYSIRITYYQTLAKFVEAMTRLEVVAGRPISSLPIGEGL